LAFIFLHRLVVHEDRAETLALFELIVGARYERRQSALRGLEHFATGFPNTVPTHFRTARRGGEMGPSDHVANAVQIGTV
jgi:hypothetical protein